MGANGPAAIAVHLVDLPQMLEDVLRDVLSDAGCEVTIGPPSATRSTVATVVVMRPGANHEPWLEQLVRHPDWTILLIEPRDGSAMLVELWPAKRSLGVLDSAAIVAAVRSATGLRERCAAAPEADFP